MLFGNINNSFPMWTIEGTRDANQKLGKKVGCASMTTPYDLCEKIYDT